MLLYKFEFLFFVVCGPKCTVSECHCLYLQYTFRTRNIVVSGQDVLILLHAAMPAVRTLFDGGGPSSGSESVYVLNASDIRAVGYFRVNVLRNYVVFKF
jgi:hypothetical protein